ncbi:hypothetical protein AB1Y20_002966 [Prymnesium parvum]|uniref:ATP-dependent transporter ycf16 n=1 Tax=Prymnesium parvum TaxID=97485 RepID=A0AB34JD96_PRYPA
MLPARDTSDAPQAPRRRPRRCNPCAPRRAGAATAWRLLALLDARERAMVLAAVLITSLSAVASMALPLFSGKLISVVSSDDGFAAECRATPAALAACRRAHLAQLLLVMAAAFVVSGAALAAGICLFQVLGERLVARLRSMLFGALVAQDMAFFDVQTTGDLMNRLSSDCTELQTTLSTALGDGMHNVLELAIGLVVMLVASPRLTLAALSSVPLIALFAYFHGSCIAKLSERYQAALASASDVAQQTLSSMRTVRSFAMERAESRRYDACVAQSYALGRRHAYAYGSFVGVAASTAQFALVLVIWYGCTLVIDQQLSVGELTTFLLLAVYVIAAVGGLMELFSALMSAVGVSRRVFALLDARPELHLEGGQQLGSIRGKIELNDLSFTYPSRPTQPVLNGVSLSVDPGQVLALCGPSGAGKSSIVALLERWYDPSEGTILVDGFPLTSLDVSWWRRQLALVAQEPVLFNCSVLDNVRYGQPEADTAEVINAMTIANALSFVETFSNGHDTLVGERGVQLSGGQKQRLAIARALLAQPSVLLLDEATSALDAESEALVQQAIDKLMENRTTIVIAHRLSTIRHAGNICVFERGRIVEKGTHDELLEMHGLYERLVQRQMQGASV